MRKAYSYTRFSTPEQRYGESYARQRRLAEEWVAANGYQLIDHIDGFQLRDEGKSGFHGEHLAEGGALGEFLRLVRAGEIEPGSALVVESLDRLSREGAMAFLPDFLSIINGGVTIVTLLGSGARVYEKGKVDDLDLIISILELSRAHEESATKSFRSWKNHCAKRDAVRAGAEKGLHLVGDGAAPLWIRILKDGKKGPWPCELIPERVEIIKQMIDMYLDGNGEELIAKKLNTLGIDTWPSGEKRKAKQWTKERIFQILRNRQLIGEHQVYFFPHLDQPGENKHKLVSRKIADRVPDGPPITNFFPAAVDEETWLLLTQEVKRRSKGKPGRRGEVTSMFGGLARCGYCANAMIYVNKGLDNRYLTCATHKNSRECIGHHVRYQPVEDAFLRWCREVNLGSLIGRVDHRLLLGKLGKELAEAQSAIAKVNEEIDGLERQARFLKSDEAAAKNAQAIDSAYAARKSFEERMSRTEAEIADLESSDRTVADHLDALRDLQKRLEKAETPDERRALRLRLRSAIAAAVSRIDFFHDGLHDRAVDFNGPGIELVDCCQEELADLNLAKLKFGDNPTRVRAAQKKYNIARQNYERLNTGRDAGCFLVTLKNGSQRLFRLDELTGGYREHLALEVDKERLVIGGTAVELNSENLTEEQLRQEIADPLDDDNGNPHFGGKPIEIDGDWYK